MNTNITLQEFTDEVKGKARDLVIRKRELLIEARATAREDSLTYGSIRPRVALQVKKAQKAYDKAVKTNETTQTSTGASLWQVKTTNTQSKIEAEKIKLATLLSIEGAPSLKPMVFANRKARRGAEQFCKDNLLNGLFTGEDKALFGASLNGELVKVAKAKTGEFTIVK